MARIRTIKPTFFFSEDIAAISIEARLLFIGLWCIADKQGRLEDRPKRIKAELYPYDQVDVDALLEELNKTRLINRYTTDNNGCTTDIIQVVNFSKHQRCHHTEQDSQLPEYKEGISKHRYITVKQPLDNGEYSEGKEGKGREVEKNLARLFRFLRHQRSRRSILNLCLTDCLRRWLYWKRISFSATSIATAGR